MTDGTPNANENLTEEQLKFGYWFVTHKPLLKKLLIVFLILFDAAFLAFGIYGFADYYYGTGVDERRALGALKDDLVNRTVVAARAPADLQIGQPVVIPSGDKIDAAALLRNPNVKWAAKFDYYFVVSGEPAAPKAGFILPNEEKFLLELGRKSAAPSRAAQLVISNLRWLRLNPHLIPDYPAYAAERLRFAVSDISFNPAFSLDKAGTVGRVTFTAENKSAYGYWQVGFPVILYRGDDVVGANYVVLEQFLSGEKRAAAATWFESVAAPSRVEVRPEVDILNPAVYITLKR